MSQLELVALVVRDYDGAIRFFVDVLQFELVEDSPSLTNDGRPKRWGVVRPPGAQTAPLLPQADGGAQRGGAVALGAGRARRPSPTTAGRSGGSWCGPPGRRRRCCSLRRTGSGRPRPSGISSR